MVNTETLIAMIPHEWVLLVILAALFILAAVVIYKGNILRNIAKKNLTMLEKLKDVSALEQAVLHDANHEQAFKEYEDSMGRTDATSILFEHVKAIYDAGSKSSRLDADLLVENTVNKIFAGIDSLKTMISVFLVIGILGTLLGLAFSIGSFSGENFILNNGEATATADALSNLFVNLRSAFTPSICGVFFTIAFVLWYTLVIQDGCVNKFKEKLTITTIRNWLPKLYPTDFQRGDKSIVKLNAVISNAEGINQGVTDLEKNLNSSNETLRQLTQVSVAIDKATNRFDQSTNKIAKLQSLYEEIQRTNTAMDSAMKELVQSVVADRKEAYQEYLALANDQSSDLQKRFIDLQENLQRKTDKATADFAERITSLAKGMGSYFAHLSNVMKDQKDSFGEAISVQNQAWQKLLQHQENQLTAVIQQLKSYDTNFFQTIDDTKQQLQQSVKENNRAVAINQDLAKKLQAIEKNLLNRQDEVINAIQTPIVAQLNEIAKVLAGINDPLRASTGAVQKMLENNVRSLTAIVNPLQEVVNKLQQDKAGLDNQQKQIATMLANLQGTLSNLNKNIKVLVASSAKGVSEETMQKYLSSQSSPAVATTTHEEKEQKSFLKKHLVTIVIAVLLFISMIIQGVMVASISSMQQTQSEVNQILLKGDMNNSSSGSNP